MTVAGTERSRVTWLVAHLGLWPLTIATGILLIITLSALEWFAEHLVVFGILLFAPPQFLSAPAVMLGILALWRRRWRIAAINAVCIAMVMVVFIRPRVHSPPKPQAGEFSVVTHNIGQGNRGAFVDAFPGENPDAVLLQDVFYANRRERDYVRRFPGYKTRGLGQYMLLTPHEIESASLVREALWRGQPVAARFVVKFNGRSVAIYCVHMPTPRDPLHDAISPRVLLEMLGVRNASTGKFASYREWIDARVTVAREIAMVFEKEELPFVVGGDFNTPDHGVIYHTVARNLRDAHIEAGRGWGFTFPGGSDSRVSKLIGHWLRLDYLFAGRGWKPVDCRVADDERSQHRAVLARFAPLP